jgi:hypothetical protein
MKPESAITRINTPSFVLRFVKLVPEIMISPWYITHAGYVPTRKTLKLVLGKITALAHPQTCGADKRRKITQRRK